MPPFLFMGLFSKKKTTVASVAINTVADTPNTGKDSVLLSVLTDGDMSGELINNYSNGLGLKMRNLQHWADSNYYYGLPSASISSIRSTDVRVRNIIQAELGVSVVVASTISGTVSTDSLAYQFMQEQRGWEYADNRVTLPPAGTVGLVQYSDSFIKREGVLVIQYLDSVGIREEEVVFPGLKASDAWYHASYTEVGSSIIKYWNYEVSTNIYPELQFTNLLQAENPYFPIVPFRVNNVDQSKDVHSEAYKTTVRLLNKLGMNFVDMNKSIHDNPDIEEVDQAFLYIAVPLMSEEMNTIRYLQAHFEDLERISSHKKINFDTWNAASNNTAPPPVNTIYIKDSTLDLDFTYTYIHTEVIAGDSYPLWEGKTTANVLPRGSRTVEYTSGRNDTVRERELFSFEQSTITFEVQVAKGVIHRTTVHGLYVENHIYGTHSIESSIASAVEDKSTLLVPVNVNVVNDMGIKSGDRLYYDAMWLIMNSYKVTKLKWYETKIFKAIIQIVAIIITIYSLGTMAEVAIAAYQIGAAAVARAIITQIIINLVIAASIDFLMKEVGLEAAIILATAAALYGVGGGGATAGTKLLPFADAILELAQIMVKEILEDIGEAINTIQDELDSLLIEQDDIEKEFKRLEEELKGNAGEIDYLDVIRLRPNVDLTESPSSFYHRAIHSGNIGMAVFDAPANYVDTMLELPTNKSFGTFGE